MAQIACRDISCRGAAGRGAGPVRGCRAVPRTGAVSLAYPVPGFLRLRAEIAGLGYIGFLRLVTVQVVVPGTDVAAVDIAGIYIDVIDIEVVVAGLIT